MRTGQRVYWHGIFPDPKHTGTIKCTGSIRHEVLWDGAEDVTLVNINMLAPLSKVRKCCPYCKSKMEALES